jgi:hypothetical protein
VRKQFQHYFFKECRRSDCAKISDGIVHALVSLVQLPDNNKTLEEVLAASKLQEQYYQGLDDFLRYTIEIA